MKPTSSTLQLVNPDSRIERISLVDVRDDLSFCNVQGGRHINLELQLKLTRDSRFDHAHWIEENWCRLTLVLEKIDFCCLVHTERYFRNLAIPVYGNQLLVFREEGEIGRLWDLEEAVPNSPFFQLCVRYGIWNMEFFVIRLALHCARWKQNWVTKIMVEQVDIFSTTPWCRRLNTHWVPLQASSDLHTK